MSYHFAIIFLQTLFKHCSAKFDGEKKRFDAVTRPSGNLDINLGIAKTLYLTSEMFLKFIPQYFLLCLVIQHQHHFVTITHSLQFPLHPFRGIH